MYLKINSVVEVKREKKAVKIKRQAVVPKWVLFNPTCGLCMFDFDEDMINVIELEDGKVMFCHNRCLEEAMCPGMYPPLDAVEGANHEKEPKDKESKKEPS